MTKTKEELKEYKNQWLKNKCLEDPNYYKKTYIERKEYLKKWTKNRYDPDKTRNKNLIKTHGITLEQYSILFEEQKGFCKICGKHQSEMKFPKNTLVVDHCHLTNKIRGLLCHSCNFLLGHAYDDKIILLKAIEYLT